MQKFRRVTLRCLCDDLVDDWGSARQRQSFIALRKLIAVGTGDGALSLEVRHLPPASQADHPLVSSFHSAFEGEDHSVRRENIGGLSEPHWWKQKCARWRGAATDSYLISDDEVWLCAGGRRAAGEMRDFYATFTGRVTAQGADFYLPKDEDQTLQRVVDKIARHRMWLTQLQLATCVLVIDAIDKGQPMSMHIHGPAPEEPPLFSIELEVTTVAEDASVIQEVILTFAELSAAFAGLAQTAQDAIRAVIAPVESQWRLLPGSNGVAFWSVLMEDGTEPVIREVVERGDLQDGVFGEMPRLGVIAHYASAERIVSGTIAGNPVRALCGQWFVPVAPADGRPLCPTCADAIARLSN